MQEGMVLCLQCHGSGTVDSNGLQLLNQNLDQGFKAANAHELEAIE